MDPTRYAFAHGVRRTRETLALWQARPWPVLRVWIAGSLGAAVLLLLGVWLVAAIANPPAATSVAAPPFAVGDAGDVARTLGRNLLVLAFHAMACVAGFIAGSSLPLQARAHRGLQRAIHEHGGRIAIAFVVCATAFSLTVQALVLGNGLAALAAKLGTSPGLLLLAVAPHALPELCALFLPLAAWLVASRRGEWDRLLAATAVTVALAVPVLAITATWEVYVAAHIVHALV